MNRESSSKMKKDIETQVNNLELLIKNMAISSDDMKNVMKQLVAVRKAITPKKSSRVHNANSGLQKPLRISTEMAEFAGWDINELHSRVDVTKVICDYVKKNNIQKENDKRIILLDKKLKDILHHEGDEITYPHIQKYISIHLKNVEPEKTEEKKETEKIEEQKAEKEKEEKKIDVIGKIGEDTDVLEETKDKKKKPKKK